MLALALALGGCSSFHSKPAEQYVFVTAKTEHLRDRVAAVSNRTGDVQNGDRLKVLDHARHFLKVQTDKGQIGWIEERAVATPEVSGEFDQLREAHKSEAAVATAVVRDQVYLHVKPGRDAERFYLLNEGDKLKLLRRASVEKVVNQATIAHAQKAIPQAAGSNAALKVGSVIAAPGAKIGGPGDDAPAPPAFEDWWLVQDAAGHTGWIYARMIDVDAPDALTRYSEGARFVGAYILTTVHDDDAPGDVKDIPVYVTVLSPYKAGLPYDFDQVRVFTWSLNHHRYETGFREKNIEGYLPVNVGRMKDPAEKGNLGGMDLPSFSYKLLTADAPAVGVDATTGEWKPTKTVTQTFRLEGNLIRRLGSTTYDPSQLAHPEVETEKKGKKKR